MVVEHFAQLVFLFLGELGDIEAEVAADGHAFFDALAFREFLEPALEVFELVDVLALGFPVDRPGVTDHVGNGVLVPGQIGLPV